MCSVVSVNKLLEKLPDLVNGRGVAILLTTSGKEIEQLISIREMLRNIRIIWILSDQSAENISRGHKLYPRYLSYKEGNFNDVSVVLKKWQI